MDLLYGNDGTNYRVLARSQDLSPQAAQLLVNSYLAYYPVRNRMPYSRPEFEPESIYYVTSDLGGELGGDAVILAKNGRMTRTPSPSTYMHVHVERTDNRYFREDFFEIFRMGFIRDTEVRGYMNRSLDGYRPELSYEFSEGSMDRSMIRSVLYLLFDRNRLGHPVRIILDTSGDSYNRRAREVLNEIYHYLPYDLRRRFGFATYMDENQSGLQRVFLQLFDRAQLKEPGLMDLDLGDFDPARVRAGIRKREILEFVDYLTALSGEDREEYFDELDGVFGGSRMSVDDLLSYDMANRSWRGRTDEELLPLWVDYIFENGLMGGTVYNLLKKKITGRLDNETYNDYLFGLMEDEEADVMNLPENVRRTIIMADEIEGLSIDSDRMQDYYRVHVIQQRKEEDEDPSSIMAEVRMLEGLDIGSPHFHEILLDIAEGRRRDAESAEARTRKIPEKKKQPEGGLFGRSAKSVKKEDVFAADLRKEKPAAAAENAPQEKPVSYIQVDLINSQGLLTLLRETAPYLNMPQEGNMIFHIRFYDVHMGKYITLKMKMASVRSFLEFLLVPVDETYRRFLENGCPKDGAAKVRLLEYLAEARLFHSGHIAYLEKISRDLPGSLGTRVREMADRLAAGRLEWG